MKPLPSKYLNLNIQSSALIQKYGQSQRSRIFKTNFRIWNFFDELSQLNDICGPLFDINCHKQSIPNTSASPKHNGCEHLFRTRKTFLVRFQCPPYEKTTRLFYHHTYLPLNTSGVDGAILEASS